LTRRPTLEVPVERPTIGGRLRHLRADVGLGQGELASALGLSISAVSRLERGVRKLGINQLQRWSRALGHRVEIVFWRGGRNLTPEETALLQEVAAALPHMPPPAREALQHEVRLWRAAGEAAVP
jgi:transcriptional regulator with XRE-family HTH domain